MAETKTPALTANAEQKPMTRDEQLAETADNYRKSIAALEAACARDGVDRSATIATEKANLERTLKQIKP